MHSKLPADIEVMLRKTASAYLLSESMVGSNDFLANKVRESADKLAIATVHKLAARYPKPETPSSSEMKHSDMIKYTKGRKKTSSPMRSAAKYFRSLSPTTKNMLGVGTAAAVGAGIPVAYMAHKASPLTEAASNAGTYAQELMQKGRGLLDRGQQYLENLTKRSSSEDDLGIKIAAAVSIYEDLDAAGLVNKDASLLVSDQIFGIER